MLSLFDDNIKKDRMSLKQGINSLWFIKAVKWLKRVLKRGKRKEEKPLINSFNQ